MNVAGCVVDSVSGWAVCIYVSMGPSKVAGIWEDIPKEHRFQGPHPCWRAPWISPVLGGTVVNKNIAAWNSRRNFESGDGKSIRWTYWPFPSAFLSINEMIPALDYHWPGCGKLVTMTSWVKNSRYHFGTKVAAKNSVTWQVLFFLGPN